MKQIDEPLAGRVGTPEDSLRDKLDLLAEGQQMLSERMDRMEVRFDERIDVLENRVDAIVSLT